MPSPAGRVPAAATAREHLLSLRAQGYSLVEIGRQVGRSPRALRFVLDGQRSGEQLVDALTQLDLDGTVTHQAPRPVTKAGRRARVRAPGGRSVEPPPPAGAGVRRRRARIGVAAPTDVRQLIDAARADGLSYAQIGQLVGRSKDTIRRAHQGRLGAQGLEPLGVPLTELYEIGAVTHQAGRHVKPDGSYAKVRTKGGGYVEPPTPKGARKPAARIRRPSTQDIRPRPGRIASTGATQPSFLDVPTAAPSTLRGRAKPTGPALRHQELAGGAHFYQGTVSRAGRKDRQRMNAELVDVVNGASNSLRRIQLTVHIDGRAEDVKIGGKGGYDPATVAAAIESNGGSMWGWLETQLDRDRYGGLGEAPITNVQIHVW